MNWLKQKSPKKLRFYRKTTSNVDIKSVFFLSNGFVIILHNEESLTFIERSVTSQRFVPSTHLILDISNDI